MNEETPLVSIVIPVYNVEKYIEECIDSILNQTYKNIEVHVIDDGSTDDSLDLLKKYRNENIFIHVHLRNKGQAAARNLGIDASRGEYLLFIDADDLIRKDTVDILVSEMKKYNVSLIRFDAVSFNDQSDDFFIESAYDSSIYLTNSTIYKGNKLKDFYLSYTASPVLYLVKRDVILQNSILFYEGIIHEDELFTSNLYISIKSAVYVNQKLYKRRYRENSTMTDKSEEQLRRSFDSYLIIIKEYEKILKEKKLNNTKKSFIKYRINTIIYSLRFFSIDEEYKIKKISEINKSEWFYNPLAKYYYRFQKFLLVMKNKLN